jgi:hypothetical protein
MPDKITGPLSREEFRALSTAPFGTATDVIRKYDPLYGRQPGEKIRWLVTLTREVPERGYATVIAETEEEAAQLAANLTETEIDWEPDCDACYDEGTIEKIVPESSRVVQMSELFD